MRIKDAFEIKDSHQAGHSPGLVVVLDTLIAEDPGSLIGQVAVIRTPSGNLLHFRIADAKEHGPVNSLFFSNATREDVPLDAEIVLRLRAAAEPAPAA